MEYNGYHAVVTFDDEVGILHGEVIDTRDVITFQGKSADEMRPAFRDSVDEYLTICAERDREPDNPSPAGWCSEWNPKSTEPR